MTKIYVSSTLLDLADERDVVMDWIVKAGHQPVHSYRPDSATVRESCLADVADCNLYVLILGYRYGFRPERGNPEKLSITHLEFRQAGDCGLPRIVLLRPSSSESRLRDYLDQDDAGKLRTFLDEINLQTRPGQFRNPQELITGLSTGVQHAMEGVARAAHPVNAIASLTDEADKHLRHRDYSAAEHACAKVLVADPGSPRCIS